MFNTAKSLEKYPIIKPGTYPGLWSAYYVEVLFENGKRSDKIKLNSDVRGLNCKCTVTVDDEGQLYVK